MVSYKGDKPLKFKYRVNQYINSPVVRLIDENGNMVGDVSIKDALLRASDVGLDLVEVDRTNNPPICKILDYGKMLYNIKKKQKHTKNIDTKIIKIRYNTNENDLNIKAKKLYEFLEDNNPVKIVLHMSGRENQFRDIARQKLIEYANRFKDKAHISEKLQESKNSITIDLKPKN